MHSDNQPSGGICKYCRCRDMSFIAIEFWEKGADGEPLRKLKPDGVNRPRYELWGCKRCKKITLAAVKDRDHEPQTG